jgi:YjjG family noncanonical pyrimidine nucleotidase
MDYRLPYKSVFFDLDHTLWDYETNSKAALLDLYNKFNLLERGVTHFEHFFNRFREVNLQLWDLYDRCLIGSEVIRQERFKQILETFNAYDEDLFQCISDDYLDICPKKNNLMPDAYETLEYLSDKYKLTLITNGFEEIQNTKLKAGKLDHFFDHIITSQKAGHRKPAKQIFDFALTLNNITSQEAIMIGDNLVTDIAGARNADIDTVFYNPYATKHNDEVKYEIQSLKELCAFL